ncbi:fibrillin-2 [Copidosoma floridanum]|uniref:fibrillin-2 n=1 Tax=Copidosoma floridanum TaxID=29053 RepID=UPI0006C9B989|nr:fibrillin-2 [Copidosoma floridanum]
MQRVENSSAEEDYLEQCCEQGTRWAEQKLRCEKFAGAVPGVPRDQQPSCFEAVDICCRKAFQDMECELGKQDARAGRVCQGADGEIRTRRSALGVGDFRHDCCEGCKLGIASASSGKACARKKFSLGPAWDPSFMECCNDAKTSSSAGTTTISTSTSVATEFDYYDDGSDNSTSTSTFDSDDLCKLLKGLLCSEICVPTRGSYYCKCHEGSILQQDGRTCVSNTTTIRPTTKTTKKLARVSSYGKKTTLTIGKKSTLPLTGGGPAKPRTTRSLPIEDNELNLPCPSGYRFNATDDSCNDVDECLESTRPGAPCPAASECLNTNGSYRCLGSGSPAPSVRGEAGGCDLGYSWNATLERCVDVDECLENSHKCLTESETCINLEGSYECEIKCERGFVFNGIFGACLDINECEELINICPQLDTICINTLGGFECRSLQLYGEPNYVGNGSDERRPGDYESIDEGDIDECQVHQQPCASGEICRNTPGGYDCIPAGCPRGFDQVGDFCQDIDECELNLHACAPYERCQNTNGSFTCESPRPTRPLSTTEPTKILCRKGFKLDNETDNCVDVDECVEGPGCRDHERCRNTLGSYDCSPLCGPGWYFNLKTKTCQDVDECLLGHHNCRQRTQYCRNTNGSYVCEPLTACASGYRRIHDGSCVDVDECLEGSHTCSPLSHRYCVNREGGYECITRLPSCSRGFEYSLLTRDCEDVDECRGGTATCDPRLNEQCINLPGSYKCERRLPDIPSRRLKKRPACPAGYTYDAALRKCSDIDECAEGSHNCGEQQCYNLPGSFQCAKAPLPVTRRRSSTTKQEPSSPPAVPVKCNVGYRYEKSRNGCVDTDECTESTDTCSSSSEECVNTPGSYSCACRPGFRRDESTGGCVDVNECLLHNDCLIGQRCDNTIGSYACVRFLPCGTGYTLNAATEICEDDNECVLNTHDCGSGYHCRNTLGSYRCDRNRPGGATPRRTQVPITTTTHRAINATSATPKPSVTTTSKPSTSTVGMKFVPKTSTQATTTSKKPDLAPTSTTEVVPTVGTLVTSDSWKSKVTVTRPRTNCPRGFEAGALGQCIDVDECRRNVKMCGNQRCINTLGSFRCESKTLCGIGYAPDRVTGHCVDVNECAEGVHKCGPEQTCENRPGEYVCYCPPGHEVSGSYNCVDVNECKRLPGLCGNSGHCVNTPGSYTCTCKPGFKNEPGRPGCADVDECHSTPGVCQQECYNTFGGYRCECRFGYNLRPDNRTCEDVDECTEFKDHNLCIGICDNTPGSYACKCPEGYRLGDDGRTCMDIDECSTGNVCRHPDDICMNLKGGFRCNRIDCPPGYVRDHQRLNRCMRENLHCPLTDHACIQRPVHYTYNYIGIVSMYPIPVTTGQVELFTMRGSYSVPNSSIRFGMALINARAPPNVLLATEACFALRQPFHSQAVLVITKSLQGPQDIELELSMEIYGPNNALAGSAVAKIYIIVTQYEY